MRMNIFVILMIVGMMQVSASTYGQKITYKKQNVTLESVIREIRKQTSFDVLVPTAWIDISRKIDADFRNASLDEVMQQLLKGYPLTWSMEGKMIIVKPGRLPEKTGTQAPVMEIKGRILDQEGKAIPGATIQVKGNTGKMTVSNAKGEFSITVNSEKDILVISSVGYQRREVKIKPEQDFLTITLEISVRQIDDVVVTGMSERKKEIYTGSSTTFSGKELMKLSTGNILQGLGLLDPSFRIIENNVMGSDPNALPNIEIRGSNTLSENYDRNDLRAAFYSNPNLPLFILDGFETTLERVIDLDMNRIESITLLKDGAAAAIYGTRSANGVVVIVTKAPAAGKLRTTYVNSSNLVIPDLTDYRMLDAARLLELEQRVGIYRGSTASENVIKQDLYNDRLALVKSGVNTYWLSQPLQTALEQRHSLTLDGGDQTLKYSIGLAAATNPGVMKGSSRKTYQGNMMFHYTTGKFLFRNDLQIATTKGTNSPYGSFQNFVDAKPYFPIPANNGAASPFLYETFNGSQRNIYVVNPLYDASLNVQSLNQYTEIINNFSAEWNTTSYLRFRATASFSRRLSEGKEFTPANHSRYLSITPDMENYSLRGDLALTNSKSTTFDGNLYAIFSKLIKKHSLFFQTGVNIRETVSGISRMEAQGFPNPKMDDPAFARQYKRDGRPEGLDNTSRLAGMLASFNYAFDSRYFADLSYKLDGSSQFGANEKFAPVWSVGLGWNLHRETFIKNIRAITLLRLTASIAETASQNFAPYQAMTKYKYETNKIYDLDFGALIQGMGNNDLKWQTTSQRKIAMDLGLFRSRLNINAEYYWKNTTNLLQTVTLAPSTGFPGFTDNIGELTNNGYEVRVTVVVLPGHASQPRLSVWGNIGANENRISKISDAMKQRNKVILDAMQWEYDGPDRKSTFPPNIFTEGASRSAIYALPSLGIDPVSGREIFLYRNGTIGNEWRAADQVVIADERPVVSGGFGTNLNYKGWDVVVAGGYSYGGYLYNSTLVSKVEDIDLIRNNVDERAYDAKWARSGDEAQYGAFSTVIGSMRAGSSSRFVQKNNFLVISAITVGHTFNRARFVKRLNIQNLRLSASMNDIGRFSTIAIERGTQYPFARRISFGLNVSF